MILELVTMEDRGLHLCWIVGLLFVKIKWEFIDFWNLIEKSSACKGQLEEVHTVVYQDILG